MTKKFTSLIKLKPMVETSTIKLGTLSMAVCISLQASADATEVSLNNIIHTNH